MAPHRRVRPYFWDGYDNIFQALVLLTTLEDTSISAAALGTLMALSTCMSYSCVNSIEIIGLLLIIILLIILDVEPGEFDVLRLLKHEKHTEVVLHCLQTTHVLYQVTFHSAVFGNEYRPFTKPEKYVS
jgi:hypothetical protein